MPRLRLPRDLCPFAANCTSEVNYFERRGMCGGNRSYTSSPAVLERPTPGDAAAPPVLAALMESLSLERGGPQLLVMEAVASRKPREDAGEPAGLEQGCSVCRFQLWVPGVSRSYFSLALARFATAHLYGLPLPPLPS